MSCPGFTYLSPFGLPFKCLEEPDQFPTAVCGDACATGNCATPFARTYVSHLTAGGTYVGWELRSDFLDSIPHTFQLQVGRTPNPDADDWLDVGSSFVNSQYAIDDSQRVWGKYRWTHYRVRLTTPQGTYYSDPIDGMGTLGRRDWRLARNIVRKERLRLRVGAGVEGLLLKRKHFGQRCDCLDEITHGAIDDFCQDCYGTGYVGGYFLPIPCVYAELSPTVHYVQLDDNRGTVNDHPVVAARMLASPQLFSRDVWIDRRQDARYYVHSIKSVAELRGVPVVTNVELALAPYSDVIYSLEIDGQLPFEV